MGYAVDGKAPQWLMSLHLVIIYMIPPMLVALIILGVKGKRKTHIPLAVCYLIIWSGALITGAMIFLSGRGLL